VISITHITSTSSYIKLTSIILSFMTTIDPILILYTININPYVISIHSMAVES